MSDQEFESIAQGDPSLLSQVEGIVVEGHRRVTAAAGEQWSQAIAYRWMRYEDPEPVARLIEAVEKLDGMGVSFDPLAVEKACAEAVSRGFSN